MNCRLVRFVLLILHFLLGWAGASDALHAADSEASFRAVKARLVAELRSAKPEVRAEALRKFQQYPVPDAAQALLTQIELTKFADVRGGSIEILRTYGNSPEVAQALLADVLRDLKADKVGPAASVRLLVLVSGDDRQVRALAQKAFAEIEKSREGPRLMIGLVDQLAGFEDGPATRALLRLEEETIINAHLGLKRALVQALCRIEDKDAVTRLVQRLISAEGETRADIERRLHQISGVAPGSPVEWSAWWADKQANFVFPPAAGAKPDPFLRAALGGKPGEKPGAAVPSYYGLPLYGSRIVFVIDFSGSMGGLKIEAAKAELRNAINLLPVATRFNMIAFNSEVTLWQKELVGVSPQTKREATIWVNSGQVAGKTHSYDALAAALAQDCDAIYFLTDGAPTGGRITNPVQIVSNISGLNRIRRATINTLGIAPGAEGSTFDDFLRVLAQENFGVYKRLN